MPRSKVELFAGGSALLATVEGFHRYLPWCRVVRSVTGALGRLVGVVAVALRIGYSEWPRRPRTAPRARKEGTRRPRNGAVN